MLTRIKRWLWRRLRPVPARSQKAVREKVGPPQNTATPDSVGTGTTVSGRLRREKPGGEIHLGNDCVIEGGIKTESATATVRLGNNVYLGGGSVISSACSVVVGDDVLISYQVVIMDSDSHSVRYSIRKNDLSDWRCNHDHDWSTTAMGEVVIGKGAWIGARSMILKGVTIGEGAVIGAGSVVTRNVPPWSIAAGNPARVIRELRENER